VAGGGKMTRDNARAKVQIGAELLCKSAKVRDIVSGGRWQRRVAGGGANLARSNYVVTRSRPYPCQVLAGGEGGDSADGSESRPYLRIYTRYSILYTLLKPHG